MLKKRHHARLPALFSLTIIGLVLSTNPIGITAGTDDRARALSGQIKALYANANPANNSAAGSPEPQALAGVRTLNLRQAMDIAKTANLDVLLSEERIREAIGQYEIARSVLLPKLDGIASETRLQRNPDAIGLSDQLLIRLPDTIGPYNIFNARFSGKIPLINISAIQNWRAAKANKQLSEKELSSAREEAMALIASLYLYALRNQEFIKVAESDIVRDKRLLQLAQDKKKAGSGTELDVMRAEVEVSKTQEKMETAKVDLTNSLLQLTNALGIGLNEQVNLTDALTLTPIKAIDFKDALVLALQRRPDLIEQQQRELVAWRKKGAAVAELLPVIEALGDYGRNGKEIDDSTDVWTAGVQFTLPLWDSFQRHGDIKQYKSKLAQAKNRTLDLKRSIETEIRIGLKKLESKKNQVEVSRETLKLLEEELRLANDRYEAGTGTNIDVIKAQTQVSEAEFQVVEKIYDYNRNRMNWFKALGKVYEATD